MLLKSTLIIDKIKDFLFVSDSLYKNTAMILMNAIYFKGQWAKQFDPMDTCERDFHIDEQTIKKVPTMSRLGNIRYDRLRNLNASFVEIPYVVMKMH